MSRRTSLFGAVFLIGILMTSVSSQAAVTVFASGQSVADIVLDDPTDLVNNVAGGIALPARETVTDAQFDITATSLNHSAEDVYVRDRLSTSPWKPYEQGGAVNYSDPMAFSLGDTIELAASGYRTDFEGNDGSVVPGVPASTGANWERGEMTPGSPFSWACASGNWCAGTNLADDWYRDDSGSNDFVYTLDTPPVFIKPGQLKVTWDMLYQLYANKSSTGMRYYDCAYVRVRDSGSVDGLLGQTWEYIELDASNSTGTTLRKVSSGAYNTVWPQCNGPQDGGEGPNGNVAGRDHVIAGRSTPFGQPPAWVTGAVQLLNKHQNRWVQLQFVLERTPSASPAENVSLAGLYIDNIRFGDLLSSREVAQLRRFNPTSSPLNMPDGFGVLNLDSIVPTTAGLTVDIIDIHGNIITDRYGTAMADLQGPIIELWDIYTDQFTSFDLQLTFTSNNQLGTASVHSVSAGTLIGSGFNDTRMLQAQGGTMSNESWGGDQGDSLTLKPLVYDADLADGMGGIGAVRNRFSRPVTGLTPMVQHTCIEDPYVSIISDRGAEIGNATDLAASGWGPLIEFADPVHSFHMDAVLNETCIITGLWARLQFGFWPEHPSVDIGQDGDSDWSMPAAGGSLGHQSVFAPNIVDLERNDHYGYASVSPVVGGHGGYFILPLDAEIRTATISIDLLKGNIGAFDLRLVAGQTEQLLGHIQDSDWSLAEQLDDIPDFAGAIKSLLDHQDTANVAYTDAWGNTWVTLYFHITNSSDVQSTTIVRFTELSIIYEWSRTLGDDPDETIDQELNQGLAIIDVATGTPTVPVSVTSSRGGRVLLTNLDVQTSPGYVAEMSATGIDGLYATGETFSLVSNHSSSVANVIGARLLLESTSSRAELAYGHDSGQFSEVADSDDIVTLVSTQVSSNAGVLMITWTFLVNPAWNDSAQVRVYAATLTDDGVISLPGAALIDPVVGNAVENDAGMTAFRVMNGAGVEQTDLAAGRSSYRFTTAGSIRLEDLPIAPDPASYELVLEEQDLVTPTIWTFVNSTQLALSDRGDFQWNESLDPLTAGTHNHRVCMANFTGGEILAPPTDLPEAQDGCAEFTLTFDSFAPQLVNISVKVGDLEYRLLQDDTWVVPDSEQTFRIHARDLPAPPTALRLRYWLEEAHDANEDGFANASEYASVDCPDSFGVPGDNFTTSYDCQIDDTVNAVNKGLVSLYVESLDDAGNAIVGGGETGMVVDLITYKAMSRAVPGVRGFFIFDSMGLNFTGVQNTVYAGNQYDLCVAGRDDNGWRDVEYVRVDLAPDLGNMVVLFRPRDDGSRGVASTDSPYMEVVNETYERARMTRPDGTSLLLPHEEEFLACIPIRFGWSVPVTSVVEPQVYVRDFDAPVENRLQPGGGRYKQDWRYSTGLRLEHNVFTIADETAPFTEDVSDGWVFSGDSITLQGHYVFETAFLEGVDIRPETTLRLEVTRLNASSDPALGYVQQNGEVLVFDLVNGTLNSTFQAPIATNEYTYRMRLIDLPAGAVDHTRDPDGDIIGRYTFGLKVDGNPPEVRPATWTGPSETYLPSSHMSCFDASVGISEREGLVAESIQLNWGFTRNNNSWAAFVVTFPGQTHLSQTMNLDIGGDSSTARVQCLGLWPAGGRLPTDIQDVTLRVWFSGSDSAGNGLRFGGDSQVGFREYQIVYEEPEFVVDTWVMSPSAPEVGEDLTFEVRVKNVGTASGTLNWTLVSLVQGAPRNETSGSSVTLQPTGIAQFTITADAFTSEEFGVLYRLLDSDTGDIIYTGDPFNVLPAEDDLTAYFPAGVLALVGLGFFVILLAVLVITIMLRGGRSRDEFEELLDYDEDEDFLPPAETMEPMQEAQYGQYGGYEQAQYGGSPSAGPPPAGGGHEQATGQNSGYYRDPYQ